MFKKCKGFLIRWKLPQLKLHRNFSSFWKCHITATSKLDIIPQFYSMNGIFIKYQTILICLQGLHIHVNPLVFINYHSFHFYMFKFNVYLCPFLADLPAWTRIFIKVGSLLLNVWSPNETLEIKCTSSLVSIDQDCNIVIFVCCRGINSGSFVVLFLKYKSSFFIYY